VDSAKILLKNNHRFSKEIKEIKCGPTAAQGARYLTILKLPFLQRYDAGRRIPAFCTDHKRRAISA
jgi:hypothetical protein